VGTCVACLTIISLPPHPPPHNPIFFLVVYGALVMSADSNLSSKENLLFCTICHPTKPHHVCIWVFILHNLSSNNGPSCIRIFILHNLSSNNVPSCIRIFILHNCTPIEYLFTPPQFLHGVRGVKRKEKEKEKGVGGGNG